MAREKLEPRGAEGSPEAAQRQPRGSPEAAEGSARLQLTHWALTDWQLATHTPLTHRSPTRTGPCTLNTIRRLSLDVESRGAAWPFPPLALCVKRRPPAPRAARLASPSSLALSSSAAATAFPSAPTSRATAGPPSLPPPPHLPARGAPVMAPQNLLPTTPISPPCPRRRTASTPSRRKATPKSRPSRRARSPWRARSQSELCGSRLRMYPDPSTQ